ncbi:hypothetical protein KPL78_02095 [Roseomonas sp. HJA6]|uniref:Uncharacterized protein n=1 Tax=Roseomonas alba TaxID=2846776 RepID=A0ABS7A3C5_9PROT|nr:hypothetical protein [Neoroseomonas alba]
MAPAPDLRPRRRAPSGAEREDSRPRGGLVLAVGLVVFGLLCIVIGLVTMA